MEVKVINPNFKHPQSSFAVCSDLKQCTTEQTETVEIISKDLFIFFFSKKEKLNINNTTFTYFHASTCLVNKY